MFDYHCHLLPGLDDGARDLDQSLSLARALAAAGFSDVYCTPHCIRGAYENTATGVEWAVGALQEQLLAADIPLRLHPGMEYYLDEFFPAALDSPLPLGDTNLLLVEAPSQIQPEHFMEMVFLVLRQGLTPLIAHPERIPWLLETTVPDRPCFFGVAGLFRRRREPPAFSPTPMLRTLVDQGCRFQGNLGAFSGYYGPKVRQAAGSLRAAGLYTHYGSDAHHIEGLPKILKGLEVVKAKGGGRGRQV